MCPPPHLSMHKGLVVLGALGRCGAGVRAEPLQLQLEPGGGGVEVCLVSHLYVNP